MALIVFLSLDRHCYGIVREAEFVLPTAVRAYYDAFVDGYREHEEAAEMTDETTEIEFMLAWRTIWHRSHIRPIA